jgi:isopenicillin N synthase-like dioxygenase
MPLSRSLLLRLLVLPSLLLSASSSTIPIVDLGAFTAPDPNEEDRLEVQQNVAQQVSAACRETGFFYVINHGVPEVFGTMLEATAEDFFARPLAQKMLLDMKKEGRAWRGYFPVGGELTSGKPDMKEGIYFGQHAALSDPKVQKMVPMHGRNKYLDQRMEFTVEKWMYEMRKLGDILMEVMRLSLSKAMDFFRERFTDDPLLLFRMFNYPAPSTPEGAVNAEGEAKGEDESRWGVGEHTDYGLLTILKQDDSNGLEVKTRSNEWVPAPYVEGSFVVNLGDILERLTQGLYRSTPHRVRNLSTTDRLSFPFFYDPGWDVEMTEIPLEAVDRTRLKVLLARDKDSGRDSQEKGYGNEGRWDGANVLKLEGTYGEYILSKVLKVFPELGKHTAYRADGTSMLSKYEEDRDAEVKASLKKKASTVKRSPSHDEL